MRFRMPYVIPKHHTFQFHKTDPITKIPLNADEKAFLALLGLHPRALQNGIGTADPNAFRRSRRSEVQNRSLAKLCASRPKSIANCKEDAAAHEEWWLACSSSQLAIPFLRKHESWKREKRTYQHPCSSEWSGDSPSSHP